MAKDKCIEMQGKVIHYLQNAPLQFELEKGCEILDHISGNIRMHFIRILPGDRVKVEISPYDLTQGRIVYRL